MPPFIPLPSCKRFAIITHPKESNFPMKCKQLSLFLQPFHQQTLEYPSFVRNSSIRLQLFQKINIKITLQTKLITLLRNPSIPFSEILQFSFSDSSVFRDICLQIMLLNFPLSWMHIPSQSPASTSHIVRQNGSLNDLLIKFQVFVTEVLRYITGSGQ